MPAITLPETYIPEEAALDVMKGLAPWDTFLSFGAEVSNKAYDGNCPICLDPLNPSKVLSIAIGDQTAISRLIVKPNVCSHHFHVGCLEAHCNTNEQRCPICRRNIIPSPDALALEVVVRFCHGDVEDSSNLTEYPLTVDANGLRALLLFAAFAQLTMQDEVAATPAGRAMVAEMGMAAGNLDGHPRTIEYLCTYLYEEARYNMSLVMRVTPEMRAFAKRVARYAIHTWAEAQPGGMVTEERS